MRILILFLTFNILPVLAKTPNWTSDFVFPKSSIDKMTDQDRSNIYQLAAEKLIKENFLGAKHALIYPVNNTKLLLPYNSLLKYFEAKPNSPIRTYIFKIARKITNVQNIDHFFELVGTVPYPKNKQEIGPNIIYPIDNDLRKYPLGTSIIDTPNGKGLTFSCAACHSAELFGVKIMGLTNRFPRANQFFVLGKKASKLTNAHQFQLLFGADQNEVRMMQKSLKAIKSIGAKLPITLGLDTSLRQTALSLARRAEDEYASFSKRYQIFPRYNPLNAEVADSKPLVWWNLKYKTRWLADGSIVSGNPVHTNFLWNEIGRGADLKELSSWMANNKNIIDQLTTYVFNTQAPKFNDFFPNAININRAKLGEKIYLNTCSKCHGIYQKGWSTEENKNYQDQIKTTKVYYHQKTPVIDVGTDPARYLGMKHFAEDLNRLKISKENNIKVVPQKGYVPPPLVGIWARWPYFHNNSAPNLCEVLTPARKRITSYIAGPAINKQTDYDLECAGYPYPESVPDSWKKNQDYYFDSTKAGLSNQGHSKMLLNKDGTEKLSRQEKLALIEFLKTL